MGLIMMMMTYHYNNDDHDNNNDNDVMSGGLTSVGASQSQLVSYGGSTFLIQPAPDGSSAPLITAVTTPGAREESGDPGLGAGAMSAQGNDNNDDDNDSDCSLR